VFLQELLDEQNISPHELAKSTGIHEGIIIDITMQLQGIDKGTAIGFATYFGCRYVRPYGTVYPNN